jgi:hypothetical protein
MIASTVNESLRRCRPIPDATSGGGDCRSPAEYLWRLAGKAGEVTHPR